MRDLGAYIGEEFSVDARKVSAAKAAIVAVSDVLTSDDGFGLFSGKKLSLKKPMRGGSSVAGASNGSNDGNVEQEALENPYLDDPNQNSSNSAPTSSTSIDLPRKLTTTHQGRKIEFQTMFVEVKSANDNLDSRQVDWINIMNSAGIEARVCKFRSRTKAEGKRKQANVTATPSTATTKNKTKKKTKKKKSD